MAEIPFQLLLGPISNESAKDIKKPLVTGSKDLSITQGNCEDQASGPSETKPIISISSTQLVCVVTDLDRLQEQKALGKSTESHLNTCCQRPANRIPELCAPITCMPPGSRDPFTLADPLLPTHTRRPKFRAPRGHLPVPDLRGGSDGAQAASADPEAGPRGRGATPPRGNWRGARKGGL